MALSNAEKVRRYRERQKAKKLEELKQPTPPTEIFNKPFFEFFTLDDQISSQYSQSLELAGIHPLSFEDDTGPESSTLDDLGTVEDDDYLNPFGELEGNSLGRAEVLVGCLLDAASDLAAWINDYKKSEIKARIAELEMGDYPDPEAKRPAFAKVVELSKMLEELERMVRWPIPLWKLDLTVYSHKD